MSVLVRDPGWAQALPILGIAGLGLAAGLGPCSSFLPVALWPPAWSSQAPAREPAARSPDGEGRSRNSAPCECSCHGRAGGPAHSRVPGVWPPSLRGRPPGPAFAASRHRTTGPAPPARITRKATPQAAGQPTSQQGGGQPPSSPAGPVLVWGGVQAALPAQGGLPRSTQCGQGHAHRGLDPLEHHLRGGGTELPSGT